MIFTAYSYVYGTPELFEETAILLWMQRNPNPYDVYEYLNGVCGLRITPNQRIVERVQEFAYAMKEAQTKWQHQI